MSAPTQKAIVVSEYKEYAAERKQRYETTKKERLVKAIARDERVLAAFESIPDDDSFWGEVISRNLTPALILDWQFGYNGKHSNKFV